MPTNYEPRATNYVTKTPESRVACPFFMRPIRHSPTCNPMATNHLPLCAKKIDISGLMRHSCLSPHSFPTTHTPQPTTRSVTQTSLFCVTNAPPARPTLSQRTTYPCVRKNTKFQAFCVIARSRAPVLRPQTYHL